MVAPPTAVVQDSPGLADKAVHRKATVEPAHVQAVTGQASSWNLGGGGRSACSLEKQGQTVAMPAMVEPAPVRAAKDRADSRSLCRGGLFAWTLEKQGQSVAMSDEAKPLSPPGQESQRSPPGQAVGKDSQPRAEGSDSGHCTGVATAHQEHRALAMEAQRRPQAVVVAPSV